MTRFWEQLSLMAWLVEFVYVFCGLLPGQSKSESSKGSVTIVFLMLIGKIHSFNKWKLVSPPWMLFFWARKIKTVVFHLILMFKKSISFKKNVSKGNGDVLEQLFIDRLEIKSPQVMGCGWELKFKLCLSICPVYSKYWITSRWV